jgi:hypothetical protein
VYFSFSIGVFCIFTTHVHAYILALGLVEIQVPYVSSQLYLLNKSRGYSAPASAFTHLRRHLGEKKKTSPVFYFLVGWKKTSLILNSRKMGKISGGVDLS